MSDAEPTPRRLLEARRKGDVPVSPALPAWAALFAGGAALFATAGASLAALAAFSRDLWSVPTRAPDAFLRSAATVVAGVAAPILAAALCGALLVGVAQTRGLFVPSFRARPSRLSLHAWAPLRALLVALLASLAASLALRPAGRAVFGLFGATPGRVVDGLFAAALAWLGPLLAVFAAVVVLDLLARRFAWRRRLRMTPRDLRREQRDEEGDPFLAECRRDAHRDTVFPAE